MSNKKFIKAVEFVLEHEGGYVNRPNDPGGETNYGISRRWADSVGLKNLDIRNMSRDLAISLYQQYFWDLFRFDRIRDEFLACKVFDLAVNVGPGQAVKLLQSATNWLIGMTILAEDGILGPETAKHINGQDPAKLVCALIDFAKAYYAGLNKPQFIKGWLKRLEDMPPALSAQEIEG